MYSEKIVQSVANHLNGALAKIRDVLLDDACKMVAEILREDCRLELAAGGKAIRTRQRAARRKRSSHRVSTAQKEAIRQVRAAVKVNDWAKEKSRNARKVGGTV